MYFLFSFRYTWTGVPQQEAEEYNMSTTALADASLLIFCSGFRDLFYRVSITLSCHHFQD